MYYLPYVLCECRVCVGVPVLPLQLPHTCLAVLELLAHGLNHS